MRRLLPLAALALLAVSMVPGLARADDSVAIRAVDTRDFPFVRVTVSTDEQSSLAPIDVRADENGVRVNVTEVELLGTAGEGVDAVLALDVSNSMLGELETALAAARTFVAGVPTSLPVGLLSFADQPVIHTAITSDRAAVDAAVSALTTTTTQGTALYEAVVAGASMFDPQSDSQHNLILLTDGKNTVPSADVDQAINAARAAGVSVFTIAIAGSDASEETLGALATRTGGRYTSIGTDDLETVYAGLAQELAQQWVITYRSKAPLGVTASLTVRLPDGTATTQFLTPSLSSESGAANNSDVAGASEEGLLTSDVAIMVLAGLVFLAVLNIVLLVASAIDRHRREVALQSRLVGEAFAVAADDSASASSTLIPSALADAAERAAGSSITATLSRRLHQAGWSLRVGEFLAIVVFAAAAGAGGGFLLVGPLGVLFALPIGVAPFVLLSATAKKRLGKIQAQLADTLMIIASSLRAGHSFLQSLDTVTKEIDEPGASEFGRTMSEIRFGRDVDDALDGLVERVGSKDLDWAVTAIKIQRKIGGNLAEILEGVAKTVRERETLRRQVRVLSAEGRISAIVLTALPIVVGLYLTQVNPEYLRLLTSTRIGITLMAVAAGLMLVGYLWMQKIVKLDDV